MYIILTFSNEVQKCLCIQFICADSSSRKWFSNVLKLMYVTQVNYRIFRIEKDVYRINSSCTATHKRILMFYNQWEIRRSVWKLIALLHKKYLSKTILMKLCGNTSGTYLYYVRQRLLRSNNFFLISSHKHVSTATSGVQIGNVYNDSFFVGENMQLL